MFGAKKKNRAPLALLAHGWAGVVFDPYPLREHLRARGAEFASATSIIAVSQLWRPAKLTLGSDPKPMPLMDGESMELRFQSWDWETRGDASLSAKARQELVGSGLACAEDVRRGLDRSIWASLSPGLGSKPLMPILPLGIPLGMDGASIQKLGLCLRRLRAQGFAVVICANAVELARAPLARPEASLPAKEEAFLNSLGQALRSGQALPSGIEMAGYEESFFELLRLAKGKDETLEAQISQAWGSLGCICASASRA